MLEKRLIAAVHRQLPKTLHHQSMTGAAMTGNGIPDHYYDGPRSDLWVEYKALDKAPKGGIVCVTPLEGVKKQPKGRLTPMQLRWLERRARYGGNAFVVLSWPGGNAVVLPSTQWQRAVDITGVGTASISEVAAWICEFCGV